LFFNCTATHTNYVGKFISCNITLLLNILNDQFFVGILFISWTVSWAAFIFMSIVLLVNIVKMRPSVKSNSK